jgi:hypothetical protein
MGFFESLQDLPPAPKANDKPATKDRSPLAHEDGKPYELKEASGGWKESLLAGREVGQRLQDEFGPEAAVVLDRVGIDEDEFISQIGPAFLKWLQESGCNPATLLVLSKDDAVMQAILSLALQLFVVGVFHERLGHASELV